LSVIHNDNTSFSKLFLFDSTTISLFSDVMKGVGRKPKNDGRKKEGLKVHIMIDAHSNTPEFVKISETKRHNTIKFSIVFKSAYSFHQFTRCFLAGRKSPKSIH